MQQLAEMGVEEALALGLGAQALHREPLHLAFGPDEAFVDDGQGALVELMDELGVEPVVLGVVAVDELQQGLHGLGLEQGGEFAPASRSRRGGGRGRDASSPWSARGTRARG